MHQPLARCGVTPRELVLWRSIDAVGVVVVVSYPLPPTGTLVHVCPKKGPGTSAIYYSIVPVVITVNRYY